MPDTGIVSCSYIMPEISAACRVENWDEIKLYPVSGACMFGQGACMELADRLRLCSEECGEIHLFHCPCGTKPDFKTAGITEKLLVHEREQCIHWFVNRNIADKLVAQGAFVVTSGWLRNWKRNIRDWGFSDDMCRDFFRESATSIVLFDTGTVEGISACLREFSECVNLPFECFPVGLDNIRLFISKIMTESKLRRTETMSLAAGERAYRSSSDYAMAFELIGDLTAVRDEDEIIRRVVELLVGLFAPEHVTYGIIENGSLRGCRTPSGTVEFNSEIEAGFMDAYRKYPDGGAGPGSHVFIKYGDEVCGIVKMGKFAFPQYGTEYASVINVISKVCGLAVANARGFDRLETTVRELKDAMLQIKTLKGLIPICASCKKIRDDKGFWNQLEKYLNLHSDVQFTHGICPECADKLLESLD